MEAAPDSVAAQLIARARSQGCLWSGRATACGGDQAGLGKALEAELDEHLSYEHGERDDEGGRQDWATTVTASGRRRSAPSWARSVSRWPATETARWTGWWSASDSADCHGWTAMMLSLSAKRLTTCEIAAFVDETYGQQLSKDTISRITDKALSGKPATQCGVPGGVHRCDHDRGWRRPGVERCRTRVLRRDRCHRERETRNPRVEASWSRGVADVASGLWRTERPLLDRNTVRSAPPFRRV